jgi:alpha-ketoglutarate-dependent taurine dioxygenase
MSDDLTLTPCQPLIGAEVTGVDLTAPLSAGLSEAIRAALLEYQVLVFRDQDVAREQHAALANIFVEDTEQPFSIPQGQAHPIPDHPEILHIFTEGQQKIAADSWHSDESFRVCPPTASVLRSIVVPKLGGDTCFSSGVAAYERLPDDVKLRIHDLTALHGPMYHDYTGTLADPAKLKKLLEDNPPVAQPIVRVHPETGKPVLFVSETYTGPIVGLDERESAELRYYLCDQFRKPDYQMRVRWQPNTIVIWDNRSVQHYAVYDYQEPREMERICVRGSKPALGFAVTDGNAFADLATI